MSAADEILRARVADRGGVKAVVAMDAEIDREVVEMLTSDGAWLSVLDYVDLEKHQQQRDGGGDVLLVAASQFTATIGQFVKVARMRQPGRPILLICPSAADGSIKQAFDAGVDDIVTIPAQPDSELVPRAARELQFTIDKVLARKRGAVETGVERTGTLICVLGLKGGSGKTVVATNLGVALASAGQSVAIVDLDLQFGDVGLALGLPPERTIYDLVRSGGSLDAEKLSDFLIPHPSGVSVLLAPVRPDQAALVTQEFLRVVLRVLREMHDFVVIDTPPGFTPEVIGAIDVSTNVLMVSARDALALKNAKIALETLTRMDYDGSRVRMLLNRANSDVGIEARDVIEILGREVDVRLPSHREIARSVNRGEPVSLKHRSEAAKVFHELARFYIEAAIEPGAQHGVAGKRRRSLFRRRR